MYFHGQNLIAVAPGATIKEQLENRNMLQKEFAIRMAMSEKHISHLINGKVELTVDVAQRLESVLGIPASVWNKLEFRYRERLARVNRELDDEQEMNLAKRFPYAKMSVQGWVPETEDVDERVLYLRRFFEVADLMALYKLDVLQDGRNENLFEVAQEQATRAIVNSN